MLDRPDPKGKQQSPVIVKKYANRRLYNTETSTYVTLEDLAAMVRSDRDFVVQDAKSGDDLTHSVLTQIIVEQESRSNGPNLLPIPFLRQLIRFYDDIGFGRIVPSYLQMSLETLTREQHRYRNQMAQSWGPATFDAYREQARKNLALFEQAMSVWTPHIPQSAQPASGTDDQDQTGTASERGAQRQPDQAQAGAHPPRDADSSAQRPAAGQSGEAQPSDRRVESPELAELRGQLAEMQRKIEQIAQSRS